MSQIPQRKSDGRCYSRTRVKETKKDKQDLSQRRLSNALEKRRENLSYSIVLLRVQHIFFFLLAINEFYLHFSRGLHFPPLLWDEVEETERNRLPIKNERPVIALLLYLFIERRKYFSPNFIFLCEILPGIKWKIPLHFQVNV